MKSLVVAAECVVLLGQVFAEEAVITCVRVYRAFEHDYGHIGTQCAQCFHEVVGERVAHHFGAVGHGIQPSRRR